MNRELYFFLSRQDNLFLFLLYCTNHVRDCRDEPFRLSSLSVMLAVAFPHTPFIILRKLPTTIAINKQKIIVNKPTRKIEVESEIIFN